MESKKIDKQTVFNALSQIGLTQEQLAKLDNALDEASGKVRSFIESPPVIPEEELANVQNKAGQVVRNVANQGQAQLPKLQQMATEAYDKFKPQLQQVATNIRTQLPQLQRQFTDQLKSQQQQFFADFIKVTGDIKAAGPQVAQEYIKAKMEGRDVKSIKVDGQPITEILSANAQKTLDTFAKNFQKQGEGALRTFEDIYNDITSYLNHKGGFLMATPVFATNPFPPVSFHGVTPPPHRNMSIPKPQLPQLDETMSPVFPGANAPTTNTFPMATKFPLVQAGQPQVIQPQFLPMGGPCYSPYQFLNR
jgi:molecular chaperone GrpE (heat shock protein)